jgi:hypothetical protein
LDGLASDATSQRPASWLLSLLHRPHRCQRRIRVSACRLSKPQLLSKHTPENLPLFSLWQRRQRVGLVVQIPRVTNLRRRPRNPDLDRPEQATSKTIITSQRSRNRKSTTAGILVQFQTAIDTPFSYQNLGTQRFHMASRDIAFKITAMNRDMSDYRSQIVRLIQFSPLRAIHWINIAHHEVTFTTIAR